MPTFEGRWRVARITSEEMAGALGRLGELPEYQPPVETEEAEGWLYRASFPPRRELHAATITNFYANASKSGPTARHLPALGALQKSLSGTWFERFGGETFRMVAQMGPPLGPCCSKRLMSTRMRAGPSSNR